jgi:hypothetical protein
MATSSLQEAKEGLERLDTNKILAAYAPTFLFVDTAAGLQITTRHELQAYFRRLFSSQDVSFSDILILEANDFAAIEWTWSGVEPTLGTPFSIKGASIIELQNGKIARESIYYDPRASQAS